jgi:ATP-dependent Lhr-like helicase
VVAVTSELLPKPIRNIMRQMGIEELNETQRRAIPAIAAGKNVLLIAPTGSGKTEAALMPILGKLIGLEDRSGISLLYITPLRALNRDMLRRILAWGDRLGLSVDVRHGDTPTSMRRKQALKPPDILITTPETLQAILPGVRMQGNLKAIRWVIVDEVHEIAESKRGAQLAVGLERLRDVIGRDFQRVGLSATVGTPEKVAGLLGGREGRVEVIRVSIPKGYSYWIQWPQTTEEDIELSASLTTSPDAAARIATIKELADTHTSTLIFVNSRQIAEMLTLRLSSLDPKIGIHHGSISREERERIEESFKKGALKALVCTSTLELGIDIGSVDLVIQYLSPRQVGALIQRVGRSGHKLGLTSEGVIITAYTDDALESIAVVRRAKKELVEPTKLHENALDVLAHQVVGLTLDHGRIEVDRVIGVIARAYPFKGLDRAKAEEVIDYVARLGLIRSEGGDIGPTRRGRLHYYANLSMIPDERRYQVFDVSSDRTIGIVGEEFVALRARAGLHFICRGMVWNIESISEDGRVFVTPVEDPRAALPGWDGEMLPLPYELANEVGKLRREIAEGLGGQTPQEVANWLCKEFRIEDHTALKIIEELQEHVKCGAPVPSDQVILVEGFDRYLIVNACLGEQANKALGYCAEHRLSAAGILRRWWCDGYRILIELSVEVNEGNIRSLAKRALPSGPGGVTRGFNARIEREFPFGYYMKFVAERFGAIQRGLLLGEGYLQNLYQRFRRTPIYEETMRELLLEKVDVGAAERAMSYVSRGEMRIETYVSKDAPTPISYHILNKYIELPEAIAPETAKRDSIERARNAILSSSVELMCMECGHRHGPIIVSKLPAKPRCSSCTSTLLALLPRYLGNAESIVKRRLADERLPEDELKLLANLRRAADIIHSYGKNGVIALSAYGIGPQTASRILSKMHYSEDDLLRDLLQAKLKYIQTRPFWDNRA